MRGWSDNVFSLFVMAVLQLIVAGDQQETLLLHFFIFGSDGIIGFILISIFTCSSISVFLFQSF